ncbi:hypothetical protein KF840_13960 [bacterium]|nr:hypothetical protein [bacterium]
MRATTGIRLVALTLMLAAATAALAEEPSIKQGFEELGRGIKADTKKGWDATKDVAKDGWDATKRGTGTALEKTGEGLNKAGGSLQGAGTDVKE